MLWLSWAAMPTPAPLGGTGLRDLGVGKDYEEKGTGGHTHFLSCRDAEGESAVLCPVGQSLEGRRDFPRA